MRFFLFCARAPFFSLALTRGWIDFLATTVRRGEKYRDYPIGAWAANNVKGIRNYPYALVRLLALPSSRYSLLIPLQNHTTNPETYKSVDRYFGVHPIGAVWAEMLWVVEQKLVDKHGFAKSLFPPPLDADEKAFGEFYRPGGNGDIPRQGNSLMVQCVLPPLFVGVVIPMLYAGSS